MRPPRSILRPDSESTQNSVPNMSPPGSEVPSKESLVSSSGQGSKGGGIIFWKFFRGGKNFFPQLVHNCC